MVTTPYKLQIFIPEDMREALREVAHQEKTSLQKLITKWLLECLQKHPTGQTLIHEP
jgi:hypothetical protein